MSVQIVSTVTIRVEKKLSVSAMIFFADTDNYFC